MPPDRTSQFPTGLSDLDLVRQVAAGNPVAQRVFYEQYKDLIYFILSRSNHIPESHIDDAFNHLFAKLFEDGCRRLKLFRGESKLSTYLSTVTRRIGQDYRKKHLSEAPPPVRDLDDEGDPAQDDPADDDPSPEDRAILRELKKHLREAVAALDARCRQVITLRCIQDLDSGKVARRLSISTNNLYVQLHRCMEILRALMKSRHPDLFDAFQSFVPSV